MHTFLNAIDRVIYRFEQISISTSILLMALVTIVNVLSRNLLSQSIISAEELSQLFIVIVTFTGTSYAARNNSHIRMSLLSDVLKGKWHTLLSLVVCVGTAIMLFFLCYLSCEYVGKMYVRYTVTPALQIPRYLFGLWAVIGFGLAAIQYSILSLKLLHREHIPNE